MEEILQLRLKEKMLLLELEATRGKINLMESFYKTTTVSNEPESSGSKSKAIPEQTVSGKETTNPLTADALLKSILKDKTDPSSLSKTVTPVALDKSKNMVICETSSLNESQASPVQTVAGKDSSNPLSPVALGKSKLVDWPLKMNSESSFRPSYMTALSNESSSSSEGFYVVYDGPHLGIYTDWGIVSKIVNGNNYRHRKHRNMNLAQRSADNHTKAFGGEEIKFKGNQLRPLIPRVKEVRLNRSTKTIQKDIIDIQGDVFESISFDDYRTLWSKARNINHEDLIHEKIFTDDKRTRSLYNFLEGADPTLVYQAFKAGLIKNIYPSSNLQEIKNFPKGCKDAIKKFRTKILKAEDARLYINITSSIPDWSSEGTFSPYYFIDIGLAKIKEIQPSRIMEDTENFLEATEKLRIEGLKLVVSKILAINDDSQIKVNYCNPHCIITSWCPTKLQKEDVQRIIHFEESFEKNILEVAPTTRELFCHEAKKLFPTTHACDTCKEKENNSIKRERSPSLLLSDE